MAGYGAGGMLTVALCRLGSRTHDAALEHLWAELTVTETFSIARIPSWFSSAWG